MNDQYDEEDIILSELPDGELVEQMCWIAAGKRRGCWTRPWSAA
jgi:hypothetical protein